MTEAWDSARGDIFRTLTFNGEPYTEWNHYEWYDYQFGDHEEAADVHYEQFSEVYTNKAGMQAAEWWPYVISDEPNTVDNTGRISLDVPMERGVYITFFADTDEHGCFVSGEGVEDGSIGVAGVTEPYLNSDSHDEYLRDRWICGAVIYP